MKNRKALTLLYTANAVSGVSQGISMLSVPWYFAQQGMGSKFNIIYAIVTFSVLFWGLFAGTLVDRFERKKVFLGTNLTEGVLILGVALLGFSMESTPWGLVVAVFAITILGYYLHYPNLYAFAQEISPPGQYTKVTSQIEVVGQSTNMLAGALAAVLLEGVNINSISLLGQEYALNLHISPWAIEEIFLLDAITYFISVALIYFIKYEPYTVKKVEQGALFKRLKSGFTFLRKQPLVFVFGFFSHSVFVVMLVMLHAVIPMYITNHLQAGGHVFGLMELFYGLGALLAGIGVRYLFANVPPTAAVITVLFLATGTCILSATTQAVPLFLLMALLFGFSNAGARILRVTYIFRHVPNFIIGRVNSIFGQLNVLMRALFVSLFTLPWFSQGSNITTAYWIFAAYTLMSATVLLVFYKPLRRVPEPEPGT